MTGTTLRSWTFAAAVLALFATSLSAPPAPSGVIQFETLGPAPLLATTRPAEADFKGANLEAVPSVTRAQLLQPISLEITLANNLDEPLQFPVRRQPEKDYIVALTDADGKLVPLSRFGAAAYSRPPIDAAGVAVLDVLKDRPRGAILYLNRIYDLSLPGRYTLFVQAYVFQRGHTNKLIPLRSKPLTIEVLPEIYDPKN
jgi:hypothetical protein